MKRIIFLFSFAFLFFSYTIVFAKHTTQSIYTERPNDEGAVFFTPGNFAIKADGKTDCTIELQKAIDQVEATRKFGIVFIPEGKYIISNTIYVWKGIRLIGYGKNRPEFILEDNTPGYQDTIKHMINFVSDKPREGRPIKPANPGTFYSALSNINFTVEGQNRGAVCIRSHYAQHCFISHVIFNIGTAMAAINKVGNEIDNCTFIGGQYGIITTKPSPSWPFLMTDCYFEGNEIAAIKTEEGGLTLVRVYFKDVPTVISVNPDRAEELFLVDSKFENISGPAIIISDEYNARPQFNLVNIICSNVPQVAEFRKSGKVIKGNGDIYKIKDFTHGLQINELGATPEIKTTFNFVPLNSDEPLPESDIPLLPGMTTWKNIKELGAKGDGETDDTEIILQAIEEYDNLYFPCGRYMVTKTILLKEKTALIGLSPISTQLAIADETEVFNNGAAPVALIETPVNGTNIINGIGLDAGAINRNAVAAKWKAGMQSYINDVKFLGGHGTYGPKGEQIEIYNNNRSADADRNKRWDNQYASLWITDGGGGTFKDIWTASPFAQAGIYVSNTSTEGRIYNSSIEHHVRNEVIIRNVSNWKFYNFQFEEESGEGWNAQPLLIENSSNIQFANTYLFRIMRGDFPYPVGILIDKCRNLDFRGIKVYSPTKFSFDNTLYDVNYGIEIRSREISKLFISGNTPEPAKRTEGIVELAKGFNFTDGACIDEKGNLYFVDRRWNKIYKWDIIQQRLFVILDAPIEPSVLEFDQSGNLLIIGVESFRRDYRVYSFNPDKGIMSLTELEAKPVTNFKGKNIIFSGHYWRDSHDFMPIATQEYSEYYVSPDGTTLITKFDDMGRTYSLVKGRVGEQVYVADEFGQKTYRFTINDNGNLSEPFQIAEEGELDVVVSNDETIYVAAGNIFVYTKKGELGRTIYPPERPANIELGKDNKTLFILGRSGIYALDLTGE